MHCFKHQEAIAVGVCCGCLKGLCANCVVDHSNFITCDRPECQESANIARELIKQAPQTNVITNKVLRKAVVVDLIVGLIFLFAVVVAFSIEGTFGPICAAFSGMSIVFIIYGVISLLKIHKYPEIKNK